MQTQAKIVLGNIKQMVMSNFKHHQSKVSYKHYPKGNEPVRMESLLMVDPNDSGISSLLTVAAMIMRVNFMQEVAATSTLINQLEAGYMIDHQRMSLLSLLQAELAKPRMQQAADICRPGWVTSQLNLVAKNSSRGHFIWPGVQCSCKRQGEQG